MEDDGTEIIILIGGHFWLLQEDGTLVEIPPEAVPEDAVVLDGSSPSGGALPEGSSGGTTSIATFFESIQRTGDEVLPESGFDTRQFIEFDRLGPNATTGIGEDSGPPPPLDPNASITAFINDNGDGFINRYEIPVVDLSGTSIELRDRQPIEVVVTDSEGKSLTFETTISGNAWRLPDSNLSSLAEGEVTVTATATDFYGNSVSGSDASVIDTLAEINDDYDYNGGTLLNAVEVTDVDMTGSTSEIGEGRAIDIVFRDTAGNSVTAQTVLAADGRYEVDDIDLSGLRDGDISVSLASEDLAGNRATNVTTIVKDTQAEIDVMFAGDPPYSLAEVGAIRVTGTVTDVEAGQVVTVTVSDAGVNSQTVTAVVQTDGTWLTEALDVSTWDEGTLTAEADVTDVAGNDATDTTTTIKDTTVTIDIDAAVAAGTALDIDSLRAQEAVVISGETDAEPGQMVTLTFADAGGTEQTFAALVALDGSWSTTVTVDALSRFQTWTLTASVQDVAGNEATDSTPTIIGPQGVVLSEQAIGVVAGGYTVDSTIRISDYDDIIFSADQSALEQVQANNVNLSVAITGGGQTLTASADGADRITAVINGDGTISVTLLAPVDQTVLTNLLRTSLSIDATQTDADGTSETVTADVPVIIRDAGTFVTDDAYQAVEDVPTSGNLFDNDNLAEGPLRLIGIEVEGSVYAVSGTTPTVITTSKGELTLYADGNWAFTSGRNLDNTVTQELAFTYRALDQDGDFDAADVVIDISDGAPGVVPSGQVSTTEPVYGAGASPSVDFTIQAGSDDLDASTIAFGEGQQQLLDALGYQSEGQAISYTVSDNTITAEAGGSTVFVMTLTAVDDGGNLTATAAINQSRPLDHTSNEELPFPLVVVATDGDGTESTATSTVNLVDGNNPAGVATDAALSEDDLTTTAQDSGTIDVTIGSDQVADIGFRTDQSARLTSGGETV